MKALILQNKVIQVSVEDFPVAMPLLWEDCPTDCREGWLFENGAFSPPVELVQEDIIPSVVTMRQARLALNRANLLTSVYSAIAAIEDETQRVEAEIELEYSSEVHRYKPWVQNLSVALGLTEEQLDSLFIEASKL